MKDIRIIMPVGTISSGTGNWQKELNIVSIDDGPFQYDLREWSLDHTSTGDGISFSNDEALVLSALLKECFKEGEEIDFSQLEQKHKAGFGQTMMPEINNEPASSQDDSALFDILKKNNLEYSDKRPKGGALWIVGDHALDKVMMECLEHGYKFYFSEKGGRVTKGAPGWYLMSKK